MALEDRIKVICSVETIRFYKNEFGIAVVSVDKVKEGKPKTDKYNQIIIKGTMPQLVEGNPYMLVADYVEDPKWGGQYNIISIYSAITFSDEDKVGQKKFLSTLFTPLQIENMYAALDNPFESLKNNRAEDLVQVRGCGLDTAARWIDRFNRNIHLAKIFSELEEFNLTNNMVQRLMEKYNSPDLVIEKVKNNPYVLCNEVKGIGWKTADKIALEGGMGEYSIERISAYMYKYLDDSGQNGCSWVTPDELMGAIIEMLGEEVPDANITEAIHAMEEDLWWNDEKTQIGLRKYFNVEDKIAKELIRIRDAKSEITYGDWEDTIKHVEHKNGWQFTEEQKLGVKEALENNVVVIHGEAGTGKSSTVSAFLEALKNYVYVQCALSGRASSRMAEITGEEGYTIHRLLKYPCQGEGGKNGFTYHDENPLDVDIVIVDEISMVDAYLFYYLLRAIPSGAKLICLGDMGQLESIGCGNIAFDMIHSPEIPTVYLSQVHRQAASSAIVTEARRIRQGIQIVEKDWVGTDIRGELKDLSLDCYSDKSNTFYKVMQKFSEAMNIEDFNIMETQILVPVKNNGDACTYNINNTIQDLYNPSDDSKPQIEVVSQGKVTILRQGDKVINTQNTYKTNPPIFNGNLGIIKDVFPEDKALIISFMGIGEVYVEGTQVNSIELGYAITVHKSQGSQFDHVIFGIDFGSYSLLTRELLYTGITRAKRMCDMVAQIGALRMAISKEGVSKKQTHLQQCLYDTAHPKLVF